jgi:hypothetical protein
VKLVKIILLILVVAFVGIQFIPTTRNQNTTVPKTDFVLVNNAPKKISSILQVSCYDCHSNSTNYPWYSSLQPGAWFMEGHINEGKAELNFSEWNTYSNRRKKTKLKSIISQIKDDKMPLTSYTLIHGDAKLSVSDKKLIIEFISGLRNNLNNQ